MVETEVAEAIPQPGGATAMDKTQCLSFATDLLGSFEAVKKKVRILSTRERLAAS
jgi:hypothetical protein